MKLRLRLAVVLVAAAPVVIVAPTTLAAQPRPAPPKVSAPQPPAPRPPAFAIRVFGDGGIDRFAATKSFNAIFGHDSGPVYGGGAEVVVRSRWFARLGAWRFEDHGERALRLENQTFRLGIPLTVT